ncbi:HAD family hydrolase [Prochlorococcus marinus XMU1406]|uniref:D-glycero-alpha-D-manno-heptose-1,7-bisphosphate 7-phosphatase n=1 Tax=Prochlorococcus marinus TaxID=1219 RepID=UPI001AD96698|nr:HAD family hydrolase [Prochlorococcus marinus]MBO8206810.1 HAD family hydrolase [Prochlorococcus marinus XMU1406]MCR8542629.1 HAD family hydrolase [Prochlorococcus marinus XMU1427]
MKRALFLDRDGVINKDYNYVYKKEDIDFIDGIFDLVREANHKNYYVLVVTNQAGIARGFYKENDFLELSNWMKEQFLINNSRIDYFYYSPYHPIYGIGKYKIDSDLRKPKPGMFLNAKKDFKLDIKNSIMIGDNEKDLVAANRAGVGKIICLGTLFKNKFGINIRKLAEAKKYLINY